MTPHAGSSGSRGIVALRYMSDESTSRPIFDPSAPPGHAILAVTGRCMYSRLTPSILVPLASRNPSASAAAEEEGEEEEDGGASRNDDDDDDDDDEASSSPPLPPPPPGRMAERRKT